MPNGVMWATELINGTQERVAYRLAVARRRPYAALRKVEGADVAEEVSTWDCSPAAQCECG